MDALAKGGTFLFKGFRFDRRARTLFRRDAGGAFVPVALGSRAFEVLDVLVTRAEDLVSRDEFMAAVWPATAVEDINLNMQIAALRRVLDKGRADGSCIQTVVGRGYRFALSVTLVESSVTSASGRQSDNGAGAPVAGQLEGPGPVAPSQLPPEVVGDMAGSRAPAAWRSPRPAVAPRLSIVVLPFANFSNDPEQQYFADAITEDLTTDLSRIAGMLVISRSTAFTYQGKRVETKQVGRELGVRYVLEGSVQRSGNRVRANARLIDAETNAHLWAERFVGDTSDLFALQDEVTSRIAISLNLELVVAEAARPINNPDALDYILKGRAANLKPPSAGKYAEEIRLFERALALDPRSAEAQSQLARALMARVLDFMSDTPADDIARADGLVAQALAASPCSGIAHYARGHVLRAQFRWEEAIAEYETVLASNRNWVQTIGHLATCKLSTGFLDDVIPLVEQAIRLSPRDLQLRIWYLEGGRVHLLQSRTDEAIIWLEKARNHTPAQMSIRANLASAYALDGKPNGPSANLPKPAG